MRLLLVLVVGIALFAGCASTWAPFGKNPTGERLERMKASPHWKRGIFVNGLPQRELEPNEYAAELSLPERKAVPDEPLPFVSRTGAELSERSDLRVTWLGHSTLIVEVDRARFLVDPVWGERASPFDWAGPERFHAPPLPLAELPEVDAIVISHDHYDHLDHPTIVALKDKVPRFIVPLGVGAHLEHWGVAPERIVELDWWEETAVNGVRLASTPSRHFSGRGLGMMRKTLWSGWAFVGPEHRAWYSGDTAMHPDFLDVGERYGPFDVTMVETGAYGMSWADYHLGPEQAVAAHQMARGEVMIPVHWGTFDLATHAWTAPAERVIAAAEKYGATVAIPRLGESVDPRAPTVTRWWPALDFLDAETYPVRSSRFTIKRR
jgi:L-ascorbate metabolism protein UlaG (beta-lactamase superfamily)